MKMEQNKAEAILNMIANIKKEDIKISKKAPQGKFQQFFNEYNSLYKDILLLQEQIKFLEEITEYKSPSLEDKGSGGGCFDKLGINCGEIADLRSELEAKTKRLLLAHKRLYQLIQALPNADERWVMTERYINRKCWSVIAEEGHYSERWVYRLHKKALSQLNSDQCQ